jgi:dTDP-glucose 4,6-dehydratase
VKARALELVRRDCQEALKGNLEDLAALKGCRLLVTGGTGFLGTWIAEAVSCLNDDFGFGLELTLLARHTELFTEEVPHLAHRKDLSLRRLDVRSMAEVPQDTSHVIHAAATPDGRAHATNPVETMHVIAAGTASVLQAVERCSSFTRMLNVSSALVYGAQPGSLDGIPEDFAGAPSLGAVSSAYAEAKRYAETYCSAARSQLKLPVVTARPFAFVGPYQSLERPWAINNFLREALNGQPLRVQGDGQTVRSYLYGADAALWLLVILARGEPGQAYNVGSAEAVTLEKLASTISAKVSPRPEVRLHSAGSTRVPTSRLVPDVRRAGALGLKATMTLDRALEQTIAWHRVR